MNSETLKSFLNKAEDVADEVLRKGRHILPTVGRFCIVSTFLEDGIRMWTQWGEQRDYMMESWRYCGWFLGTLFVLINLCGQLGGSVMVLIRKHVNIACGILFFIIALQTLAYNILWDFRFLLRSLALAGGVVLLIAEVGRAEGRSLFAGLPTLDRNTPRTYMQLGGRILLVLMYVTLLRMFDTRPLAILHDLVAIVLIIMIAVGYKTKLSAFASVIFLSILNIVNNNFWAFATDRPMHDYLKYDFFQTLSVVGGLLLVVAMGPGGVSLDEYKKET